MSGSTTDVVKVRVAMVATHGDHNVLTLVTVDGVTVEFALDDMATALLMLTGQSSLSGLKARRDSGQAPTLFGEKEIENG